MPARSAGLARRAASEGAQTGVMVSASTGTRRRPVVAAPASTKNSAASNISRSRSGAASSAVTDTAAPPRASVSAASCGRSHSCAIAGEAARCTGRGPAAVFSARTLPPSSSRQREICAATRRPCSGSTTPWAVRWKTGMPSQSSSLRTCCAMAPGVTLSSPAAAAKPPRRAAASNALSALSGGSGGRGGSTAMGRRLSFSMPGRAI